MTTYSISIPSRRVVADQVRQMIDTHTTWDDWIPEFVSFTWDGASLTPDTLVMIDPRCDPRGYPRLIDEQVRAGLARGTRPHAYGLHVEAWAVDVDQRTSTNQAGRAAARESARRRQLHQHPDRYEIAMVSCVDIYGRLWTAHKRRDGDVTEQFFGDPDAARVPGGAFVAALRAAAALARDAR